MSVDLSSLGNKDSSKNNGANNNNNNANANNPALAGISGPPVNASQVQQNDLPQGLIDLHEKKQEPALFREQEMSDILAILHKIKKPNVLLEGEAGVGKTAIIEGLVHRIQIDDPNLPDWFKELHFYELSINNLQGNSSLMGQAQDHINELIEFATNPDNHAVLFIDEIHQLFNPFSHDSQTSNLIETLKPHLSRGEMRIVGATTVGEAKRLYSDPAFKRRFESLNIAELTREQSLQILQLLAPNYINKHHLNLPDDVLELAIEYADKYYTYTQRPDNALDLIDQSMSRTNLQQFQTQTMLTAMGKPAPAPTSNVDLKKQDLLNTIYHKLNFKPLSSMNGLDIELKKVVLGQDAQIDTIAKAVIRQSYQLRPSKRPLSFFIAGPSGTGKSETGAMLADLIFNDKNRLVTINMTEYQDQWSMSNLLGSPNGYVGSDTATVSPLDKINQEPFSVLLLNEFEKAAPQVQQVFMEALETGILTDRRGKTIDFSHAIVIATSNAGTHDASQIGGFGSSQAVAKTSNQIKSELKRHIKIEILNRFTDVLEYQNINKDNFTKIALLNYHRFIQEVTKERPDLTILPDENASDDQIINMLQPLIDKHYSPEGNGRPVRNLIDDLEEVVIQALMQGQNQVDLESLVPQYVSA